MQRWSSGDTPLDTWQRLGKLISNNMVFIVPACLALGILVPQVFVPMKPAVSAMFAFISFQGALGNNLKNIRHTFAHPLPMFASITISQLLIPVLAFLFGSLFFGGSKDILTGIVLEYSVPIAVTSTMWVGIYEGNMAQCMGTLLISSLISPFTIPATLSVLMGAVVHVDALSMVMDMLFMVAIPAVLGTLLNDRTHGRAKTQVSPVLAPAARILTILVITINSTSLSGFMRNLTPELFGVIGFIAVFASSGYLWGYLAAMLMRLGRDDAVTVTFCTALRNIAAGAIIAQAYFAPAAVFPVMTGTLFNQFLAAIFGRLLFQRQEGADA